MHVHDVLLSHRSQATDPPAERPAEVSFHGHRLPGLTDKNFTPQNGLEHVCSEHNLHFTWLRKCEIESFQLLPLSA